MTDLRRGVTKNQHAILELADNLPAANRAALLEFAIARAKQAARTTNSSNALAYAREAAARMIAWSDSQSGGDAEATKTASGPMTASRAVPAPRLAGKRLSQLRALLEDGAVSRNTAIAAALVPCRYYPATLSRMVDEGRVEHGYFAKPTDRTRSLSHYWLAPAGADIVRDCGTGLGRRP